MALPATLNKVHQHVSSLPLSQNVASAEFCQWYLSVIQEQKKTTKKKRNKTKTLQLLLNNLFFKYKIKCLLQNKLQKLIK